MTRSDISTPRLTVRQLEVLAKCAGPHGMYDHTRYETAILNRLYEKGLALRSCNGTAKWHATQSGRRAIAIVRHGVVATGMEK